MVAFVNWPGLVMDGEEEVRIPFGISRRWACRGSESSNGEDMPSLLSWSESLLTLAEPKTTLQGSHCALRSSCWATKAEVGSFSSNARKRKRRQPSTMWNR